MSEPARLLLTWGDADAVIATLLAERDAARQEVETIRQALSDILAALSTGNTVDNAIRYNAKRLD